MALALYLLLAAGILFGHSVQDQGGCVYALAKKSGGNVWFPRSEAELAEAIREIDAALRASALERF